MLTTTSKLYLVSRTDLSPGQQAIQAAHALQELNMEFPLEVQAWYRASNTLAFLVVSNESDLKHLYRRAKERGTSVVGFHEPDLEGALTAVGLAPSLIAKKLCAKLNLALPED